jgi:hypothetical protein
MYACLTISSSIPDARTRSAAGSILGLDFADARVLLSRGEESQSGFRAPWSSCDGAWPDSRLTQLMKQKSEKSIGIGTPVRAWRQLAAGIAIKESRRFFVDLVDLVGFNEPGDAGDDLEGPLWLMRGPI